MKFLCDENLPKVLIFYLRKIPHSEVKSVIEEGLFGLSDEQITTLSLKSKSIVVTFDKDFLVTNKKDLKVIYLHFPRTDPKEIVPYLELAVKLIPQASKKKGGFIIYATKQSVTVGPHDEGLGKK